MTYHRSLAQLTIGVLVDLPLEFWSTYHRSLGQLTIGVLVGHIKEVSDAVLQGLERRDQRKEFRARNDAIVRSVDVAKLPNGRHDQRVR